MTLEPVIPTLAANLVEVMIYIVIFAVVIIGSIVQSIKEAN